MAHAIWAGLLANASFYQRMIILRRSGLTAIGLSGNRYKGRSYAVLTIGEDGRIIHLEHFSGWTYLPS
ncbi:MAG: hypothetical protein HS114_14525 [Anaerolineales bacterium]|nr:hypothetical protein [Anaerolineales bacterium]